MGFKYKETSYYENIANELINMLAEKKCTIDEAQQILKLANDKILTSSIVQEVKE